MTPCLASSRCSLISTSTSLPPFTKAEETSAGVVPLLRFVSLCCPVRLLLRRRPEGRARESAVRSLTGSLTCLATGLRSRSGRPAVSSPYRARCLVGRFCFPTHPPGGLFFPLAALFVIRAGGFDGASRNLEFNQQFYRQSRRGGRGSRLVGRGARKSGLTAPEELSSLGNVFFAS